VIELPYPVILASASPRRKELLASLVADFEVVVVDIDEDGLTQHDPWGTAETLARAKAEAVSSCRPNCIVIGGDTIVVSQAEPDYVEYEQLGKPESHDDAVSMLQRLSGCEHLVVTGVCIVTPQGTDVFSETTHVEFRELSLEEIEAYVRTGEPMDKAGAYAIQGGAAGFVEQMMGSHSNVVGLPIEALEEHLSRYAQMAGQ
jgi:septum formation protein